jgi:hypothetical protein
MEILLEHIEKALPLADAASLLGGEVLEALEGEARRLEDLKENTPLWRQMLDKTSWRGERLK